MTSTRVSARLALLLLCFCATLPSVAHAQGWVLIDAWGAQGTVGAGGFNSLQGVAAGQTGYIYAVDDNYIQKFLDNGHYLSQWRPLGATSQSTNIRSVATDASGNVFIGEHDSGTIQKFSPTGQFLLQWAVPGAGNGQGDWLSGLAIDAVGSVYVTDAFHSRVMKFSSAGAYLSDLPGGFGQPTGVAIDGAGNIFVADYDRVRKFSSSGLPLLEWGSSGSGPGHFGEAFGIGIDRSAGFVYVSDLTNPRVQQFNTLGGFISQWGQPGTGAGALVCPEAVSVGPDGDVFVADGCSSRIRRYRWTTLPVSNLRQSWGRLNSRYR